MILGFGKYKGTPLDQVPEDYLLWLIDVREKELKAYRYEIERREEAEEADMGIADRILATGYREMAKRLHPDVGGSHEAMKELNAARDWLKEAVRGQK